jgi:hypothetical protein
MTEVDLLKAAEIAAWLAHFPDNNRSEVVARLGLRWAEWQAIAARLASERDAEIAAGKVEASSRFARAFAAAETRLATGQVSLESIGPLSHSFRLEKTDDDDPPFLPEQPAPEVEARQLIPGASTLGAPPYRPAHAEPMTGAPRYLAETSMASSAPRSMPLPFREGPPSSRADALDRARAHADAVQGPPRSAPLAGGTALAPEAATQVSIPAGVPHLTLEQYTSLRVELQLLPDRTGAILRRYGVGSEAQSPLFAFWKARLAGDPTLRMAFSQRYAQYVQWLQGGGLEKLKRELGSA